MIVSKMGHTNQFYSGPILSPHDDIPSTDPNDLITAVKNGELLEPTIEEDKCVRLKISKSALKHEPYDIIGVSENIEETNPYATRAQLMFFVEETLCIQGSLWDTDLMRKEPCTHHWCRLRQPTYLEGWRPTDENKQVWIPIANNVSTHIWTLHPTDQRCKHHHTRRFQDFAKQFQPYGDYSQLNDLLKSSLLDISRGSFEVLNKISIASIDHSGLESDDAHQDFKVVDQFALPTGEHQAQRFELEKKDLGEQALTKEQALKKE